MRAKRLIAALWLACAAAVPAQAPIDHAEALRRRRTPIVDVFNACKDAVVNISSTQIVEVQNPFDDFDRVFGGGFFDLPGRNQPRTIESTSVGSGFVVHRSGYIVTNAHVVAQTAQRKVIFADKTEYEAETVGVDVENDLAVLKIKANKPVPELKLGRSDDLMVGETTVAIGNPLGLGHTVTSGVVSALDRELQANNKVTYKGLIQTDASINPGNSGGPLFNVLGELIGVNFAIRGDGQNIGFAIPVDRLSTVLPSLLDVERRYRIIVGMQIRPGPVATVSRIVDGQPAAAAGIKPGDRILSVGDQPVGKTIDAYIGLLGHKAGEVVPVTFERQGQAFKTQITLAEKPKPDGKALALSKLGAEIDVLTPNVARRLGLRRASGLIITKLEENGPAAESRLEPADVLVQINRSEVTTLDDLGLLLEDVKPGQRIRLVLLRVTTRGLFRITTQIETK